MFIAKQSAPIARTSSEAHRSAAANVAGSALQGVPTEAMLSTHFGSWIVPTEAAPSFGWSVMTPTEASPSFFFGSLPTEAAPSIGTWGLVTEAAPSFVAPGFPLPTEAAPSFVAPGFPLPTEAAPSWMGFPVGAFPTEATPSYWGFGIPTE